MLEHPPLPMLRKDRMVYWKKGHPPPEHHSITPVLRYSGTPTLQHLQTTATCKLPFRHIGRAGCVRLLPLSVLFAHITERVLADEFLQING